LAHPTLYNDPTTTNNYCTIEQQQPLCHSLQYTIKDQNINQQSIMWWSPSSSKKQKEGITPGLAKLLPSLGDAQADLCRILCSAELRQSHLFEWGEDGDASPAVKRMFVEQLEALDEAYPTGLAGYIENARELLEKSQKGINPLEGWKPSVPVGMTFELGSEEYTKMEEIGRHELGSVGFVLVAGGLGERLGYGDIKIGLPSELATGKCYLQFYIEYILALQERYVDNSDFHLTLCIMTSADTNKGTIKLLEDNDYFGMNKENVTIVQQGDGVPALLDNDATLALEPNNAYKLQTKPHGHGDIHSLLFEHEVAKKWVQSGVKWITFFQDTNGLAFHTLPLALGVSVEKNLIMNSMAIPRKAKQAVGAICKLTNDETGETRTINIEYNQLDPLLRANGHSDGDVNDPKTGFSPFPGNINGLLFAAEPYLEALNKCEGLMPEFVNPKYKDSKKTTFKKPTRLECMMQDFPTVLTGDNANRVGFTSISADLCFSPVKNATADGVALQEKGTHPGCAASGEADQYGACRKILRSIGVKVTDSEPETYKGVSVVLGPEIVIAPGSMCCPGEYREVFPHPEQVSISARSSLVIKGTGKLTITSMNLDGALVLDCEDGADAEVRDLNVKNEGWVREAVDDTGDEVTDMRGYKMVKKKTAEITYNKKEECIIL